MARRSIDGSHRTAAACLRRTAARAPRGSSGRSESISRRHLICTGAGAWKISSAATTRHARAATIIPRASTWWCRAACYSGAPARSITYGRVINRKAAPGPMPTPGTARMMALRSGDGARGVWREEHRDKRADLRLLFGEDITHIDAGAVMTDTDDTGLEATAYYQALYFSDE